MKLTHEQLTEMLEPVGPYIFVDVEEKENKTTGGIIIPDSVLNRENGGSSIGVVVALGPECYQGLQKNPSGKAWCKVGDRVSFRRYAGERYFISVDGEEVDNHLRSLNDEDVRFIVKDPKVRGA